MWQEIMMDVSDVDGDRFAGVRTLPVIFFGFWEVLLGVGTLWVCVFLGFNF